MTSLLDYLTEGPRIFFSSLRNRFSPRRYEGDADKICRQIVKECWNGRYFQTSTSNFAQFWARDFNWCVKSLMQLGYQKEVYQTLRYALNRYIKYNKVTTTITPSGRPFDYPLPAVDSLPSLIHSIKVSKFPYHSYKNFLNKEINKFFAHFIDQQTGLVKQKMHVSSIKDQAVRNSSCYDNCMVGLLAKDLKSMKLANPLEKFNYAQLIKEHFWTGFYFYDDLEKKDYVSGDANLFPFLFGLITEKEMMSSALAEIRKAELDFPLPLKYTNSRNQITFIWQEKLAMPDYESNALWTQMGILFVKWVQEMDQSLAEDYKQQFKKFIEKNKGFVEVFTADGKPYKSWFYRADQGMLWAANYLTL